MFTPMLEATDAASERNTPTAHSEESGVSSASHILPPFARVRFAKCQAKQDSSSQGRWYARIYSASTRRGWCSATRRMPIRTVREGYEGKHATTPLLMCLVLIAEQIGFFLEREVKERTVFGTLQYSRQGGIPNRL